MRNGTQNQIKKLFYYHRYVANERSLAGRLFWVCIITAGFTVAGIMVSSSMRDANANPIITSVESIPVQVKRVTLKGWILMGLWLKLLSGHSLPSIHCQGR